MTTQEIHQALNQRAKQKISQKHLHILMDRFEELGGQPITDENLHSFLHYAWE